MGYIKSLLLATALAVSTGFIQMAPDPLSHVAYGASVSEDTATLLKTLECPKCNLFGADLQNAKLSMADLKGANLNSANLSNADLSGANLQGADLREANLGQAVLYAANLALANLGNADLSNANLHHVDLKEANVQFTNFAGAAGLSKEEKEDLKKRGAKVD